MTQALPEEYANELRQGLRGLHPGRDRSDFTGDEIRAVYNDTIAFRNLPLATSQIPISLQYSTQVNKNPQNRSHRNRKKNKSGYNGGIPKNNPNPSQGNSQSETPQPNAGSSQSGTPQPNAGTSQGGTQQPYQGNNQGWTPQPYRGRNPRWGGPRLCYLCGSPDHVCMQCPKVTGGSGGGYGGQPPTQFSGPNRSRRSQTKCCLCEVDQGSHMTWDCPTYSTPATKRQRYENTGRCVFCTKTKHDRACHPNLTHAYHPNYRHFTWLCGGHQDPHPSVRS